MSETKAGLARRARDELAKATAVREFLAFELSAERYALPLACVREIMRVSARDRGAARAERRARRDLGARDGHDRDRPAPQAAPAGSAAVRQEPHLARRRRARGDRPARRQRAARVSAARGRDRARRACSAPKRRRICTASAGRPRPRRSPDDASIAAAPEELLLLLDPATLLRMLIPWPHAESTTSPARTSWASRSRAWPTRSTSSACARSCAPLPTLALPHVPSEIVGVVDHRGDVVPVIDLRKRFGVEPRGRERDMRWIIVSRGERLFGLAVDRRERGVRRRRRRGARPAADRRGREGARHQGRVLPSWPSRVRA